MTAVVVVGVGAILTLLVIVLVAKMTHVVTPNEVLIVSGSRRTVGGQTLGYRSVRGGRAIVLPGLENVEWIDITTLVVHERVLVRSKQFVPLSVELVATVRIAAEQPMLDKAVMRLLGKSRDELSRLVRDTVGEAAAGIVAHVTPETLLQERAKVEQMIGEEVEHDLGRVGLRLEQLSIRGVTDDVGYLAAIS